MAECELAAPVMAWLTDRGYTPFGEIRWYDRAIDVVGLTPELVVAVELKTSLTRKVLYQSHLNQLCSNYSWCAVGTRPRKLPDGPFSKIGILSVSGGVASVIREAERNTTSIEHHLRAVRGVCHYKQPGGAAGLPGMCGIGPAQDVFNAVELFCEKNPGAGWQRIWEEVPNHYKHARSMQVAMRVVRQVRESRERRRELST